MALLIDVNNVSQDKLRCWELEKSALDLINRQKAENERLRKQTGQFADIGKMYSEIKAEAYKECNQKTLMCLDKFREEIVDKFIIMCDGNDYNKLNLMSMVDTIDSIYDKHMDNLLKEMVGDN